MPPPNRTISTTAFTAPRRPRGYVGRGHETIGSDILSVLKVVASPAKTLGAEAFGRLEQVRADGWYPIEWLLDLMGQLHLKVGDAGLRKMGRELFKLSHAEQVRAGVGSARELLHGFDALYRRANRGQEIGGWLVLTFRQGYAELEKTTPHHCLMEEGIMMEALACVGTPAVVTQQECFRKGADSCRFVIRSAVGGARWNGPLR